MCAETTERIFVLITNCKSKRMVVVVVMLVGDMCVGFECHNGNFVIEKVLYL